MDASSVSAFNAEAFLVQYHGLLDSYGSRSDSRGRSTSIADSFSLSLSSVCVSFLSPLLNPHNSLGFLRASSTAAARS